MSTYDLRVVLCSGKRYIGKELGVSEPGKAPPQDASDRWISKQTRNFHRQEIFTDKTFTDKTYSQTRHSQTRHIHREDASDRWISKLTRMSFHLLFSCLASDRWTYSQTKVLGGYIHRQECFLWIF